jgi:hypothetical protein
MKKLGGVNQIKHISPNYPAKTASGSDTTLNGLNNSKSW